MTMTGNRVATMTNNEESPDGLPWAFPRQMARSIVAELRAQQRSNVLRFPTGCPVSLSELQCLNQLHAGVSSPE